MSLRAGILAALLLMVSAPSVYGQSTISDAPVEITNSSGPWIALLPAYELGTNQSSGGPAFRDNLDDVGGYGEVKVVRRFLGTRTSFDVRGFVAGADSSTTRPTANVDVPDPITGSSNLLTGGESHLQSETDHYGIDFAIRDTWRTRVGGLTAGVAFSYMALDQEFDVTYGGRYLFREDLDSDFIGGKALFGWDGCWRGRPSYLDLAIGFYDMDTDYRLRGNTMPVSFDGKSSKEMGTVETSFTTRNQFRGHQIGWTLGVKYFTDLPVILHDAGRIGDDDAVMLTGLLEILL